MLHSLPLIATWLYKSVVGIISPSHTATLIWLHCLLVLDFLVLIRLQHLWNITSLFVICDNRQSELDFVKPPKIWCLITLSQWHSTVGGVQPFCSGCHFFCLVMCTYKINGCHRRMFQRRVYWGWGLMGWWWFCTGKNNPEKVYSVYCSMVFISRKVLLGLHC